VYKQKQKASGKKRWECRNALVCNIENNYLILNLPNHMLLGAIQIMTVVMILYT